MEVPPISVKPPSPAAVATPPAAVEPPSSLQPAYEVAEAELGGMNQLTLSPIVKRQKVEEAADGNGCKHCACKKSKCVKLYCPCFSGGSYCSEKCGCQPCFNKDAFGETVQNTRKVLLSRQKRMSLKINRRSETSADAMEDAHNSSSSTPLKHSCNCKKSSCLKKYCDCYQEETGCSLFCRCEDCQNPFGKNEGIMVEDSKRYLYTGAHLDQIDGEHEFVVERNDWVMDDSGNYKNSSHDWLLSKHEDSYSISKCIQILDGMVELSQVEKSIAPDVFLQQGNREIFISLGDDVRALWLKRKIQHLT